MKKLLISYLLSLIACWGFAECAYSDYSWWYWQNNGEWGIAFWVIMISFFIVPISFILRIASTRNIWQYIDFFAWLVLVVFFIGGWSNGVLPPHEIIIAVLFLAIVTQLTVFVIIPWARKINNTNTVNA